MNSQLSQSWITDYPLLAYKSFTSDNNEIIIANLACKDDIQSVVNLGNWRFLCFVGFPKVAVLRQMNGNPLLSHICMLVKHKTLNKLRILVIEMDPWLKNYDPDKTFQAFLFKKSISGQPNLTFEKFKKAEILVGNNSKDKWSQVLLL